MMKKEMVLDQVIYIDRKNSNFDFYEENLYINKYSYNYENLNLYFKEYKTSFIVICINLSNACNLKCDYCFNMNKNGKSINIETTKQYLDLCFKTFPNKEKYYVDLSGIFKTNP